MKINTRYLYLSIALFPLFDPPALFAVDPRYKLIQKLYEQRLESSVIDITGKVTDQQGKKLDGVTISIEFIRPKNVWATESESLTASQISNGEFFIKKRKYTAVTISFSKAGYRTQTVTLYSSRKANETGSSIQTAFHVKLREIGILAQLIRFDKRLVYNVKANTQSFCDLSEISKKKLSLEKSGSEDLIRLKKYIYLDFQRDKNGRIIFGKKNAEGTHGPAPETYILRFHSPDSQDGFIVLDEKTAIADLSYLTEAPAGGYSAKEIVIPYEGKKPCYFYIKCGDFYGKGKVSSIGAIVGVFRHEFSSRIKIFFNEKPNDSNVNSIYSE